MSTCGSLPDPYVHRICYLYSVYELEKSLAGVVMKVGQLTADLLRCKMKLKEQGPHGFDLYSNETLLCSKVHADVLISIFRTQNCIATTVQRGVEDKGPDN